MTLLVISVACSAALVVLSTVQLLRGRDTGKPDTGPGVYWDEDCACCNAECGEADDQNVCLLCGH